MDASPHLGVKGVFAAPVKQLRPAAGDELFRAEFAGASPSSTGRSARAPGSASTGSSPPAACTTSSRAGAGTLCVELMTYWSAGAAGSTYPCLVDLTGPGDRTAAIEQLRDLLPQRRATVDELLGRGAQLLMLYPLRVRESAAATLQDLGIEAYLVDRWDRDGTPVPATGCLAEGVAAQEWRRIDHDAGHASPGPATGPAAGPVQLPREVLSRAPACAARTSLVRAPAPDQDGPHDVSSRPA